MKPNRWNRFLAAFQKTSVSTSLVAGLTGITTLPAFSATLTWDVSPGTVGAGNGAITGGVGTWDTTPSIGNWTADGGATNVAWVNNATPDGAIFGGTGGAVTQAGVVVNNITFNSTGYSVAGGTITLGGTNPKVTTNADATITSIIAGTAGIAKDGPSTLTLNAVHTLSGPSTTTAGRLLVSNTLRNISSMSVSNGATLELNATNIFVGGHGTALVDTRTLTADAATLLMSSNFVARFGHVTLNNGATWTSNRGLATFDALLANTSVGTANVTVGGTGASTMNGSGGIHLQGVQNFVVDNTTGDSKPDLNVNMILSGPGSQGGAAGGVNKTGLGTMVINSASNYTGTTTVGAGALKIGAAGSLPASDITANAAGFGVGGTGKTLKSLTLNAGSTFEVAANKLATTTITGALTTAGALTIKPLFTDVPVASDVYNLATAGSMANGATYTVDTSGFGASRVVATAGVTGNILQLTIGTGSAPLVWNNNAATGTWNLNTDANFDNGGSPDVFKSFDGVTFNGTAPGTVTLVGALAPGSVNVTSSTGDYTFAGSGSIVNGELVKSGSSALTISTANTHGSTVVNNGTLNATVAGATGSGTTVINGGIVNGNTANSVASASITLSGGTLNLGNAGALGGAPLSITSGTLDNTTGAAATLPNVQTWNGAFTFTGTSDLTASGATTMTGNSQITVANNTYTANGVISGGFNLTKAGAGTLRLNTGHTYSGTTNVNGGRLWVSNTLRNSTGFNVGPGATLEFGATNIFTTGHGDPMQDAKVITVDGGTLLMNTTMDARFGNVTLKNGGTWTSDRNLANYDALLANTTAGPASVRVEGTGASVMNGLGGIHLQGVQNFIVDDTTASTAADLTVNMVLGTQGTVGGAAGGINKTGTGTMVLNAINAYTGATNVNEGTLVLGAPGAIAGSAVTVTGSKLQINATEKVLNALTVNAGSTLSLAAKKLESIRITNALTTTGAVTLQPLFLDVPSNGDTYDLLSAASVVSAATYTVDMTSRGATRVSGSVAVDSGQYLVLTIGTGAANLTWTNATATGIWNHNTDLNFLNGVTPDVFKTYDAVTFGNTAAGTVNLVGTLYPGQVNVTSSAGNNYTFAGSGSIGGGTIVKSGASSLTLGTAHTPDAVRLEDGTLNVNHPSAMGMATITLTNGTFHNGTGGTLTLPGAQVWNGFANLTGGDIVVGGGVTLTQGTELNVGPSSLTLNGPVTGAGFAVIKKGNGTLNMNGATASTLNGGLDVDAGTVNLNTGTGATTVTVGGEGVPASVVIDGNQQTNRLGNLATVTIGALGSMSINGVNAIPNHANSVAFTVENGGNLTFVTGGSTASGAAGASHDHSGTMTLNNGTVTLAYSGTGTAYNGESFQLNGNVIVGGSAPSTIAFGTGATPANAGLAFDDAAASTFTVADVTGNANADLVINAELENSDAGTGAFIKDGPGTMALTGAIAHSMTGAATVTAGTLMANGSVAGPLIVQAGGTIAPGASAGSFGATNTTLAGTYACEIDGVLSDTLAATGNLDVTGGTLNISVLGGGATQSTYVVASYTGTLTGTFATVTGLPSGYSVNYDATLKQIQVTNGVANPYLNWATSPPYNLTGGNELPGADPDKDGMTNAIEFVVGGNPTTSTDSAKQPTAVVTGANLVFTYRRTDLSNYSPFPSVQYGSTLTGWTTAQHGVDGVTIVETNDHYGAGIDRVEVSIPQGLAVGSKIFARLVATP